MCHQPNAGRTAQGDKRKWVWGLNYPFGLSHTKKIVENGT